MTTAQNKAFYGYLNKLNLTSQKANIISGITNGRTESSKELTVIEVIELFKYFKSIDPDEKPAEIMRRKIIAMAHEMQWHTLVNGKHKADMKRIDDWCKKFGYLRKKLDAYQYKELPKLVSQFEAVHKHYLKSI